MENEKSIDILNALITINNDRIEGYKTAIKETEEAELKTLFSQFVKSSQACKKELDTEVGKLGGEIAEGTKTSGKFFRAWMDVKAALTGKDRKAILESCEYGEEKAKETYDDVLINESNFLSNEQHSMISAQKISLRADYNHIKTLRHALEVM